MRAAAIIAEYNPFHNGHKYHIEKTRELFGATHIAAIMSGSFCQRGECAIAFKSERCKMALAGGADLVLELPLPWALSSAERFAFGGAYIADALGCIELLSFGSESGDIESLSGIAKALLDERFGSLLAEANAKTGSFAAARQAVVSKILGDAKKAALLENPNDNLGCEYIKALRRLSSAIEPVCVRRTNAHEDEQSASHIRGLLLSGDISKCESFIPATSFNILKAAIERGDAPATLANCERALLYKCRLMSAEDFARLPDVSGGLESRLCSCSRKAQSFADYADSVKNKSVAHSRVRRAICAAFLGLEERHLQNPPPYIRVLGFNSKGRELLAAAKPKIPIISRLADLRGLSAAAAEIFSLEQRAADCFGLCTPTIRRTGLDSSGKLIVVD